MKTILYKPIVYLILAQHRRSVICYYLYISTSGKVAQHFTVINLFISLILHIYPPLFILLFASAAQEAQGLSYEVFTM
jgi:hypothetical protein